PMSIHGDGKTHIGLVQCETTENDIGVVAWDNATQTLGTPFLPHAALSDGGSTDPDTHNQPAVTRLADGTIVTAYCGHGSHDMRIRVSTSPDDLSAFGSEYVITSSYFLTYAQLFAMSGGRIY